MTTGIRSDASGTFGALTFGGVDAVTFGATGIKTGVSSKIQSISASVAANALTISAAALILDFRSTTLGSGTIVTITGTPANLVVPPTATLGTVNSQQSRLVVLAINNGGTIELAIVNIAGGNDLSETGIISTTTIAAAANAANIVYSTVARTGVAYRVIGYVESTQATAGTWATAPTTVQGIGGQALAAMQSLGVGQTWQVVSRAAGTTYYNTTGRPIQLGYSASPTINSTNQLTVNGVVVLSYSTGAAYTNVLNFSAIVPPGGSYSVTITPAIAVELR